MSGWQTGRAHIEQLLDSRWLESVHASGDLADRLLHESSAHLQTARTAVDHDSTGALQLAYGAARKAALALLTAQGLRATTDGGHKATAEAAAAQFDGTFDRLDRMRRRRNDAEYPDIDTPDVTDDDANDAIESAQRMHDAAVALIASGKLGVFAA
jgi:hypothetical protein